MESEGTRDRIYDGGTTNNSGFVFALRLQIVCPKEIMDDFPCSNS